jgi:hypothetical protein
MCEIIAFLPLIPYGLLLYGAWQIGRLLVPPRQPAKSARSDTPPPQPMPVSAMDARLNRALDGIIAQGRRGQGHRRMCT